MTAFSIDNQKNLMLFAGRSHPELAEQVVAVAALNNISVVDAEAVVAAKTGEARLEAVKKRTPSRVQPPEQVKQPERKKPRIDC